VEANERSAYEYPDPGAPVITNFVRAAVEAGHAAQSPHFHIIRRRQSKRLDESLMQRSLTCSRDSTNITDGEKMLWPIIDRRERGLEHLSPLTVAVRPGGSKARCRSCTGARRATDLPICSPPKRSRGSFTKEHCQQGGRKGIEQQQALCVIRVS
jgi:hypothetical protein